MTNRYSSKKTIAYVGFVLYFLLLLRVAVSLEMPAAHSHGNSLAPSSAIHSSSERSPSSSMLI